MTAEPLSMMIRARVADGEVAIATHAHQISIGFATCADSRIDDGFQSDLRILVVLRHHCLVVLDLLGRFAKKTHPCRCNLCSRVHDVMWQRALEGCNFYFWSYIDCAHHVFARDGTHNGNCESTFANNLRIDISSDRLCSTRCKRLVLSGLFSTANPVESVSCWERSCLLFYSRI